MKENLKNKKGITLIALVITIIVLLILAIVTIRIMTNENIIGHANNAVTAYNEAQQNEAEQLTWAEGLMQSKGGSAASSSGSSGNSQAETGSLLRVTAKEIDEILATGYYNEEQLRTQDVLTLAGTDEANFLNISGEFLNNGKGLGLAYIVIVKNNESYGYFSDYALAMFNLDELEANVWYHCSYNMFSVDSYNNEDFTRYTGSAPISNSYYAMNLSNTFLNRVIASFGN